MDIINLLQDHVILAIEAHIKKNMLQLDEKFIEERAFFYKIVGDYYRYASEACSTDDSPLYIAHGTSISNLEKKQIFKKGAMDAYKKCSSIVKKGLKPYNTVRLGLALNFSVFQYEIMGDSEEACKIAKNCIDECNSVMEEC